MADITCIFLYQKLQRLYQKKCIGYLVCTSMEELVFKAISIKAAECTEEHSSSTKIKKPYSPVVCEEHNTKKNGLGTLQTSKMKS